MSDFNGSNPIRRAFLTAMTASLIAELSHDAIKAAIDQAGTVFRPDNSALNKSFQCWAPVSGHRGRVYVTTTPLLGEDSDPAPASGPPSLAE